MQYFLHILHLALNQAVLIIFSINVILVIFSEITIIVAGRTAKIISSHLILQRFSCIFSYEKIELKCGKENCTNYFKLTKNTRNCYSKHYSN